MTTEEHLRVLTSACVELQARCDASADLLRSVLHMLGADAAKTDDLIVQLTAMYLQTRLEKIEDISPALAVSLDNRPPMPDIGHLFPGQS